jgi:hypothetical protein
MEKSKKESKKKPEQESSKFPSTILANYSIEKDKKFPSAILLTEDNL